MSSSCKENRVVGVLEITEPIGIARELEYVEVSIPIALERVKKNTLYIKNEKDSALIQAQILNNESVLLESNLVRCLFPISIQANETKQYDIVVEKNEKTVTDLVTKGVGLNIIVENEFYKADLTARKSSKNIKLGPGQITSVSLKKYNGIKLERPDIKMHWAPSFQKKNEDYKTMAHIEVFDSVRIEKGPYLISVYRSGKVKGYEEIQLEGEYKFYAGKPFFGFSSKMTMVDSLTVTMLRNDEMTMDRFFTHAIYPHESGKVKRVPLYDKPPLISHHTIKELRKQPIDANAKWFGFYNDSINYGFGSLRVQFDYKNINGGLSPMSNAQTKISYAYNEGRYWDRRFVDSGELKIPKGSKYFEDNVYFIFDSSNEKPAKEILRLHKELSNPIIVKYIPVIE